MTEQRIHSLDGLRAISISFVILAHLVEWKFHWLRPLDRWGVFGVFVFFVLSGYLITRLLLHEHDRTSTISLQDFYIRRAFRILPAAVVFIAVATVFYWHEMRWYNLVGAVFYFANMDPTRPFIFWHLWSLSVEEQFYLLWPFALTKRFQYKTPILICVLLLTPLMHAAAYALKMHTLLIGTLPLNASGLAIGCLLAIYAPRLPRISGRAAAVMALGAVLIPLFPATSPALSLIIVFVLSPILHICVAGVVLHVLQVRYRALNWEPVVWLGRISYSLYLWQQFIFRTTPHWVYKLALPAFACACLSYYFVEQPMLRLRERLAQRSKATKQTFELSGEAA